MTTNYETALGNLWNAFQGLETMLRAYLLRRPTKRLRKSDPVDFWTIKEGVQISDTHLTSHVYLSNLVREYNAVVKPPYRVDESLVQIRNALAHGRVFTDPTFTGRRLVYFDRGNKTGKAKVALAKELTPEWFFQESCRVVTAINKILEARAEMEESLSAVQKVLPQASQT